MKDCIFCKIINREVESNIIFETDCCIALLPIEPISTGHVLVISKSHYENVSDAPDEVLSHIIITTRKIGEIAKKELGATGYNILNASGKDAQQSVPHLHFHLVPRYPNDKLDLWLTGEGNSSIEARELVEIYTRGLDHKKLHCICGCTERG